MDKTDEKRHKSYNKKISTKALFQNVKPSAKFKFLINIGNQNRHSISISFKSIARRESKMGPISNQPGLKPTADLVLAIDNKLIL